MTAEDVLLLRAGGGCLLLDARGPGLPSIVHWGADLGELEAGELRAFADDAVPPVPPSALDLPMHRGLLPQAAEGFAGTPGLTGHRSGEAWSPYFWLESVERESERRIAIHGTDEGAGLALTSELQLGDSGVVRLRHAVGNRAGTPYTLDGLLGGLPVPATATELLDLTGRWCRERHPQRHPFRQGTWRREGRHGRTGHDATLLLGAGTAGFGFRQGEVWAVHVAWSGNHLTYAERLPDGTSVLGGGELLLPGEMVLEPGAEYRSPWLYAAWSGRGLDGLSTAFHGELRGRDAHPASPRPVVLNTWEAVYFDHDLDRLRGLASTAARLGVERFVLDDGWFRGRRDDTAGLGDWYVDEQVWPDGLHPLVEHVRGLGMQLGLWVEPEMVNPDSDLFRAHPDWVLSAGGRMPPEWRHQQVLDLANPEAYSYILTRMDALLEEYDIGYLKWDHNRDLVDPGHGGRAGAHAQTAAVYRLWDELRARHPDVEIESCSSGGGRVDLEVLRRTDRVWASDCNDALERQAIQRWTGLLLPPELVGSHVGPPRAHTTGRVHELGFRAVTALFGHFGIEWDVSAAGPEELAELAGWIAVYKEFRRLLHGGEVVRADHPDPVVWAHGVVSGDRSEALFAVVQLGSSEWAVPARVRLPGLEPGLRYDVRVVDAGRPPRTIQLAEPGWLANGQLRVSGGYLSTVGVQPPILAPEHALLLHLKATLEGMG